MTGALAERFDQVVALDVSPAMLEQARANVTATNVEFRAVSGRAARRASRTGARTPSSATSSSSTCPRPGSSARTSSSSRRVLAPGGEAFVQVPVLGGLLGRAAPWRPRPARPARPAARPERRLPRLPPHLPRVDDALAGAGLRVVAEDEGPSAYRFSRDRFLRLTRDDRRRTRRLRRPARRDASWRVFRRPQVALSSSSSASRCTTSSCRSSTGAACTATRSTRSRPGRRSCSRPRVASVAVTAIRARRLPFRPNLVDWLALAYAAIVLLYAVIPQSALGGHAGAKAIAYGLRHDLVFVVAYFLGRSLSPRRPPRSRWVIAGAAAAVAAWGLVEVYAVPIEWWRHSGAVGYFHHELGYDYHGPGGLPENFAFNTSDGLFRRLVSTFVSPLATAYMLVIALLLLRNARRARPIAHRAGGRLRRRPALDVLALVDRRARGRPARDRRRPPPLVAAAAAVVGAVAVGFALRLGLPRHRSAHPLVQERPPVPGGAGAGEGPASDGRRPLGHVADRRAVDQEPLGEPQGRHSHGSSTTPRATGSGTPARPPSASA